MYSRPKLGVEHEDGRKHAVRRLEFKPAMHDHPKFKPSPGEAQ